MDNKGTPNNQEVEIDLIRLLFVYLHRWWIFAICGAVAMTIAIIYSLYYLTPLYTSSISLYVNNRLDMRETDYVTTSDMSASRNLVKTYITISNSDRVMNAVSNALNNEYSADYLKGAVSAEQQDNTELFTVTVTTTDPERSALIANTIADVFPDVLADIVEGSSARVIDYGKVPSGKSYPSNTRNALIGLLIGIVVAGVLVTVEYLSDVRIMDEEDLSYICEYPLLGQIPEFTQLGSRHLGKYASKYGYQNKSDAAKKNTEADDKEKMTPAE